ncbi:MAG: hypothetical protein DRI97_13665, partial [Bacteroidetes bacterium]
PELMTLINSPGLRFLKYETLLKSLVYFSVINRASSNFIINPNGQMNEKRLKNPWNSPCT